MTPTVRECDANDFTRILEIINEAAVAYRDAIPADCWHEPYMAADELERELAAGVSFFGAEYDGELVGVMGVQQVRDADLIRHAYVSRRFQRHGIGGLLIERLLGRTARRVLVGTWADASWAIAFYERHGFTVVDSVMARHLLNTYWNVPERQSEVSVVLARSSTP